MEEYLLFLGPLAGIFAAFAMLFLILGLAVYLFTAYCLMLIAQRHKIDNAWLAFIPIANLWVMLQIAGLHWAWILIILVGFVPIIGPLAQIVGGVYILYKFLEAIKQPWWWILVIWLIPFAGAPIAFGYFAFGDKK